MLVVAAATTAALSRPVWLRATGVSALRGDMPVAISGGDVAPGVVAAAIVLLAASAAVGLVGRVGRWVAVGVVVAAGVVVVVSVVAALRDLDRVAAAAVAGQTGVGALTGAVRVTVWPWIALGVGAADAVAGLALAVMSSTWTWTGSSSRHVPAGAGAVGGPVDDDQAAWDALTRGDDPTDRG